MPADRVDPLEHVRDNFGVDLALDAEIADRLWRSEDGTHSEHERLREYEVVGGAAFIAFSTRSIRHGRRRSGRCWSPLAGQIFDRFVEAAAVKKTDESDDIALRSALTAEKNLFSDVDAEAIVTAALRARAAAIDPADELDSAARHFVFNSHRVGALDEVGSDHGARQEMRRRVTGESTARGKGEKTNHA